MSPMSDSEAVKCFPLVCVAMRRRMVAELPVFCPNATVNMWSCSVAEPSGRRLHISASPPMLSCPSVMTTTMYEKLSPDPSSTARRSLMSSRAWVMLPKRRVLPMGWMALTAACSAGRTSWRVPWGASALVVDAKVRMRIKSWSAMVSRKATRASLAAAMGRPAMLPDVSNTHTTRAGFFSAFHVLSKTLTMSLEGSGRTGAVSGLRSGISPFSGENTSSSAGSTPCMVR
mmetsp:Transcript_11244/g.43353  ORF Transcript_11244/g.43353 Transcript_11244/m.43353 type:complete len:230 (-) Transcript_11244:1415-2104(-)